MRRGVRAQALFAFPRLSYRFLAHLRDFHHVQVLTTKSTTSPPTSRRKPTMNPQSQQLSLKAVILSNLSYLHTLQVPKFPPTTYQSAAPAYAVQSQAASHQTATPMYAGFWASAHTAVSDDSPTLTRAIYRDILPVRPAAEFLNTISWRAGLYTTTSRVSTSTRLGSCELTPLLRRQRSSHPCFPCPRHHRSPTFFGTGRHNRKPSQFLQGGLGY